jgi:hypothetical protein
MIYLSACATTGLGLRIPRASGICMQPIFFPVHGPLFLLQEVYYLTVRFSVPTHWHPRIGSTSPSTANGTLDRTDLGARHGMDYRAGAVRLLVVSRLSFREGRAPVGRADRKRNRNELRLSSSRWRLQSAVPRYRCRLPLQLGLNLEGHESPI